MSTLDTAGLVKIIRGMQRSLRAEGHSGILSATTERDLRGFERQITEDRVRGVMSREYNEYEDVITDLVAVLYESS